MSIDQERGKALLTSKTFWGVVVMVIGIVAPKYAPWLAGVPEAIVEILGIVLALIGRFTAKEPITGIVSPARRR